MGRPKLDVDVDEVLRLQFRHKGYDGMSLADLARETGLQKASLYYRFPDGKESMARAALASVAEIFAESLFARLANLADADLLRELEKRLRRYYVDGRLGCLLGAFAVPATAERFRPEMQTLLERFQSGLMAVVMRLGLGKREARRRAEDFIVDLEGSLILASISQDTRAFNRRLARAVKALGTA